METVKFPYAVIYNGKFVPANTPIEVKDKRASEEETAKPRRAAKKNADK